MDRVTKLWIVAIVAVIIGELLPGNSAPVRWMLATSGSDKVLHFLAYFTLSAIPAFGFKRRNGLLAAGAMLILGWMLEVIQPLIPGRGFAWSDIAANALGITTAVILGFLFGTRIASMTKG